MRAPMFYKIAASIVVLAVAVPMTLFFFGNNGAGLVPDRLVYDRLGVTKRIVSGGDRNAPPPSPADGKTATERDRRKEEPGKSEIAAQPSLAQPIENALRTRTDDSQDRSPATKSKDDDAAASARLRQLRRRTRVPARAWKKSRSLQGCRARISALKASRSPERGRQPPTRRPAG